MLFQITDGAVSFGDNAVLKNINFEIRNTEKIAIVGRNGCGKTTLLKFIMGEYDKEDNGTVYTSGNVAGRGQVKVGWLKQMTFDDESVTLEEEIRKVFEPVIETKRQMDELLKQVDETGDEASAHEYSKLEQQFSYMGGYSYERDFEMIVDRFGFTVEDRAKKLTEFSGGQRTKIAFVKLLLSRPDILLLDEPTNHLDISTIGWLERYLKDYPRSVVIVSHDRMF